MSQSDNLIAINILDRTYNIKCPAEEAPELQEAAEHVDSLMRKAKKMSSTSSTERVAILTALNICHEMMQAKKQKSTYIDSIHEKIKNIQGKVQNFLAEEEEVTV